MANKQGRMQNLLNHRMRVTYSDGRQVVGQMMAFDKHMNIVLADTEEFRKVKKSAGTQEEIKRTLGLLIIRGANVVSVSVEGPPPADPAARLGNANPAAGGPTLTSGPGISRPAGRGMPSALTGPAAGVGGPAPPGGFGGPPGFSGGPPGGFPGAGAPPGFGPPPGFQPPAGFQPPPGFQGPGGGRGFPPPGFGR